MPAAAASTSLLFHPKKKNGVVQQTNPSPTKKPMRPLPARARPAVTLGAESSTDASAPPLPDGPYQEFKLMSSALNGWKYDVMKFDSRKPVDLLTWKGPVRLNRKEIRRGNDDAGDDVPQAVGPMLGPDGKPVIGADGKAVMVDAAGKPIRNVTSGGPAGAPKAKGAGRRFQKKTKQVYLVPEATRQLRREERYPWMLEDGAGQETWQASMEEVSKSETYAMFMPSTAEVFKFVPAHRWYKFQKKPNYKIPSLEEAETLMARIQKNKDPERWLLHNRKGQAASAATQALFKQEADSTSSEANSSRGPGGRRLRAVDAGGDLFGDDEEGGGRRRDGGGEGDLDELDFEEAPADDEDRMDDNDKEDEETKELEERLKREYKTANKTREGHVDESEEEDDDPRQNKTGNAMRKLIRNLERNDAYENDSDDDKNPYASSDGEEEEEETPMVQDGPAIQPQDQKQALAAGMDIKPPTTDGAASTTSTPNDTNASGTPQPGSRAASPAAPILGGHSIIAKRATSPKAPRLKGQNVSSGSRATSPLAGGTGSRATSPAASGSRAGSPMAQKTPMQNKRKADEASGANSPPPASGSGGLPKKKKIKPTQGASGADGPMTAKMLADYLRSTENPTTRACIQYFNSYIKQGPEAKSLFTDLVKEVAVLKDGVLILRPQWANASL